MSSPPRSASCSTALLQTLQAHLEESMALSAEFETDLGVAVQCMRDCEAERVRDVARLERRVAALAGELARALQLQSAEEALDVLPGSPLRSPREATPPASAVKEQSARSEVLMSRAQLMRSRHQSAIVDADNEIRQSTARFMRPVVVNSTPAHDETRASPFDVIDAPDAHQRQTRVIPLALSGEALREATHPGAGLRSEAHQRAAASIRSGSNSPRRSTPGATPLTTPRNSSSQFAAAIRRDVLSVVGRVAAEGRQLRRRLVSTENQLRRGRMSTLTAAATLGDSARDVDLLVAQLDEVRGRGGAVLSELCSRDDLLVAGARPGPRSTSPVVGAPKRKSVAAPAPPHRYSGRATPPAAPSPASPAWVLLDDGRIVTQQ
jgi:hypothetical protein